MYKNTIKIKKVIIMALFISLTYIATAFMHIQLPFGGLFHFGDFVAIIAALLFGPLVGAISGSLGMGLFNILGPFGPETIIRTIIIKFIMGLLVGWTFKILVNYNEKKNKNISIIILALIATIVGVISNIALEFVFRIWLSMIFLGYSFNTAFIFSIGRLPSAIIRGIVTIIFVPIAYKYTFHSISNFSIVKEFSTKKPSCDNENSD